MKTEFIVVDGDWNVIGKFVNIDDFDVAVEKAKLMTEAEHRSFFVFKKVAETFVEKIGVRKVGDEESAEE